MSCVVINGRFMTRRLTGVDRFAAELLRAWLPRYGKFRNARAFVPTGSGARRKTDIDVRIEQVGILSGHAWEQAELSAHCGDDVLLSLCNTGPIWRRRQLVVLHDASVVADPATYGFMFRNWNRWLFAGLMRRAGLVSSVSKFSAQELTKHIGRARSIEVIYGAGEHVLKVPADCSVLERLNLIGRRYVLAVGSLKPNKNLVGIARAAALLDAPDVSFVAAGGADPRVFANAHLPEHRIVMAGYVTEGELRALYENAVCFVFPSLYEGFGLPALEAMTCGCPVIASDRTSLPEVCADGAIYCNPDDPADIAAKLRDVLNSRSLRQELRAAGLARASAFSWTRSAAQLEEILSSA
jgi:glycosyltransferase involved in cell wall biosynthesis